MVNKLYEEAAYLELRGLVIDWATGEPPVEPLIVVAMLKRLIDEIEE